MRLLAPGDDGRAPWPFCTCDFFRLFNKKPSMNEKVARRRRK